MILEPRNRKGTLPPSSAIFDDNDQPKEKISTKDLPNWLSTFMGVADGVVPPKSSLLSGVEEEPKETGLEPGAIPSWVKAMRPVDSIKPDPVKQQEADRRFEEEGPLAGIRGIIPGSEVEFNYARPASKDNRETSVTNISIFENTLQAETEEVENPEFSNAAQTSNVVRWVIAVVLFIVVVMIQIGGNPPDLTAKESSFGNDVVISFCFSIKPGCNHPSGYGLQSRLTLLKLKLPQVRR